MNHSLTETISIRTPEVSFARLGATHGYRFDGETVRLNAMFVVADAAAHERAWALQLWACASNPTSTGELSGHLIAEATLPPMGEIADDSHGFEVTAPATLPAGNREYTMVLALVAGHNRKFDEIHDLAVYPRPDAFALPRLAGASSYRLEGDRVHLVVDQIENPRGPENLSGTLALELWALPAPYAGGNFSGVALAGVELAPLAGQHYLAGTGFNLPFTPPGTGHWHFALMLREWTTTGFVTRDFVNFAQPVIWEAPDAITNAEVDSSANALPAEALATPTAPKETVAVPVVKKTTRAKVPSARTKATTTAKTAVAKSTAGKASTKTKAAAARSAVSINSASANELAEVKGLPVKVAQAITKHRPYRSIDDLLKISGMGAKLLAKVRARLKL